MIATAEARDPMTIARRRCLLIISISKQLANDLIASLSKYGCVLSTSYSSSSLFFVRTNRRSLFFCIACCTKPRTSDAFASAFERYNCESCTVNFRLHLVRVCLGRKSKSLPILPRVKKKLGSSRETEGKLLF